MARGRKLNAELSLEEKLEQALVPAEVQPYPVPKNWCWIRLGSVSTNQYGYTAKAIYNTDLPKMLRITDIQDNGVDWTSVPNCHISEDDLEKYLLQDNDIVIARIGATTGKSFLLSNPSNAVFASYLIRLRFQKSLVPSYVYYFLQSDTYWKQISELASGIAQPGVNSTKLQTMMFPLPPLTEQHRIVDRIENMNTKLDEAKEKAQAVVDGFEDRKAAILHKAFTGELTAEWRMRNGFSIAQWTRMKLKDCGEWMGGGTPSMAHPEYWENGDILWVTSKDMKSDLIEDTLMHTNMVGVSNSSAIYSDKPSVLFVMRSGILRRTLPIALVKIPFTVNQDLKAVAPDQIDLDYLFWACESNEKLILKTCMKSGTTVESINATALMDFKVPIAPKEEQGIIVKTIVNLLQKEQKAMKAAEQVIDQIDVMKKSILARAFRGELGTNNPSDEPAEELLKRVGQQCSNIV